MKFRKKPLEVDLVEYAGTSPRGVSIVQKGDGMHVWNERHQSWIGVKPGDYLNVTDIHDVYPIQADVVSATYDPVSES